MEQDANANSGCPSYLDRFHLSKKKKKEKREREKAINKQTNKVQSGGGKNARPVLLPGIFIQTHVKLFPRDSLQGSWSGADSGVRGASACSLIGTILYGSFLLVRHRRFPSPSLRGGFSGSLGSFFFFLSFVWFGTVARWTEKQHRGGAGKRGREPPGTTSGETGKSGVLTPTYKV